MNKSLTRKILEAHLVEGELVPGRDIAIRIDHALLQDATGTMAMLERMKQKVNEDEATAQAFGDIAGRTSTTDEVDKLLASKPAAEPNEELMALKKKTDFRDICGKKQREIGVAAPAV
jgi:homoaconitase/3-isopropylmalate dehydratase large subunit